MSGDKGSIFTEEAVEPTHEHPQSIFQRPFDDHVMTVFEDDGSFYRLRVRD
ncbi:hypothetical protein [Haloarchaeobius amylolyticus]|uniref:hypothetical protein n=1 Tax=Haloarchaeobius amylolyticus TaxID=1198296 RepID=UPI002271E045|nr:hypothetical protein [Haloarchaeobius amylolyticus]